jgi:hypothetical protein
LLAPQGRVLLALVIEKKKCEDLVLRLSTPASVWSEPNAESGDDGGAFFSWFLGVARGRWVGGGTKDVVVVAWMARRKSTLACLVSQQRLSVQMPPCP